ncbi:MAG: preprotein translocase subunit SecE [Bacilli bacterium]
MKRVLLFLNGVKKEIERVRWPSRKHMVTYSIATILSIIFFALFFYIIDVIVALIKTLG